MSEVTHLPALGRRTPFVALADAIVTLGASERSDLHKAWWSATVEVDRIVDVNAWARRILPEHRDVLFCVRPLFRRRLRSPDPSQSRIGIPQIDRIPPDQSRVRVDVPVAVPLEWTKLPLDLFTLGSAMAILGGLGYIGDAAGAGPPPMRATPKGGPAVRLDEESMAAVGERVAREQASLSPGEALVVAPAAGTDVRQAQDRFVAQLGQADQTRIHIDGYRAWRIAGFIGPADLEQEGS